MGTPFKNQEISLNQIIAVVCKRWGKIMAGEKVLGGTNMAT